MTGGADSDLASLYVILVAVTALLMPPANAASSRCSPASCTSPTSSGATRRRFRWHLDSVSVFALVAVVIGYVSSRVNVLGRREVALTAEVRQVQLEADDGSQHSHGVITVDATGTSCMRTRIRRDPGISRPRVAGALRNAGVCSAGARILAAVTSTARRGSA